MSKKICAPQPCGEKQEVESICHFAIPCLSTKACAEPVAEEAPKE